jgi:predicted transposase YbfD/YdcC
MLILDVLDEVPDPRGYNSQHDLTDVLFVALAAMLCGAQDCTAMALFAAARLELLRDFVPLRNGAPSHDTFTRVLRALDPAAFQTSLQRFMSAFGDQARRDVRGHVAVDGKSLRRAYETGKACMPPLVATVFDCDSFMSLSQAVTEAGGERAAAIEALKLLSLKGVTVTADALHTHQAMTRTIRERGGHYVLALKGNNSTLARAAEAALDKAAADPRTAVCETEEVAHGRHEVRRAIVARLGQPNSKKPLVGLAAVARVESWRTVGGETTHKVRAYALSRRAPPADVLRVVRRHWSVENDLHWQLDVFMDEDQSRSRKNNGPANLAVLRRLALNVFRAEPTNRPLRHKGLLARWNDNELIKLITYVR